MRDHHRVALPSCGALPDDGLDQRGRLGLPPLQGEDPQQREWKELVPDRRRDALALRHEPSGGGKVPHPGLLQREGLELDRKLAERARVADDLRMPCKDGDRVVIPHRGPHTGDVPAPAHDVVGRQLQDHLRRALKDGHRDREPVGDQHGESLEHQVEWMRIPGQRRESTDGAADRYEVVRSAEVVRRGGGAPRAQVGPASEVEVERLEPSRSFEEQWRRLVAVRGHDGNVPAKERGSRALEAVERPGLGRGQKPRHGVERPRLEAGLGRGQRAPSLLRGIGSENGRPLEERGGGRGSAAALRSPRGALERGRDGFVGSGGGEREVPGVAVGVKFEIARLGERRVHAAPFGV